jgi:hypothetical protein
MMSVYGIIVGVEHYDALHDGIKMELDGPASDAVRFASWLLNRSVPPSNLHLFLSSLDPATQRNELNKARGGADVTILEATRDQLELFFNTKLPTLAQTPSTLYMLWGGHGIIRGGDEHHLFYSNFRKGSPLTFNVKDRLRQLRAVTNLSAQHIFIDACANFVELTRFGTVDSSSPVIDLPDSTVEQHLIQAAASGQLALNDKIERTGHFSRELFTLLHKIPADQWPAAEHLAPELEQAFVAKARADRTFRQRPVWLRFRPNRGGGFDLGSQPKPSHLQGLAVMAECTISQLDSAEHALENSEKLQNEMVRDELYSLIVGTPQADRSWRKDTEFDLAGLAAWVLHKKKIKTLANALEKKGDCSFRSIELELERVDLARQAIRLLDPMGLSTKQCLEAYRRVPSISPAEKRVASFEDIVTHLAQIGDLQRSPLFRFLLNLSITVGRNHRAAIEEFLGRKAHASYIADQREAISKNRTYRALVSVKEKPRSVWGLLLENDVPMGPKVERALEESADFLEKLEEVYSELLSSVSGDVTIELILRFDQLCEDLERIGIDPDLPSLLPPTPICHRFPFILRWRDRIDNPNRYGGEMWIRAAEYVRRRLQSGRRPSRWAVPPNPGATFWKKLDQPEGDLIDLACNGSSPGKQVLATALVHGAAFACWPRNDLAGTVTEYERFIERVLEGAFPGLPARAAELRRELDLGVSIAILWDDPETDPTPFLKPFEEMRETP